MCGVTGFVTRRTSPGFLSGTLERMTDALTHRGPDGYGYLLKQWADGQVIGLGHRRLKIIDLTDRSRQPFINPRTGCALVYNGEIYNYVELRNELVKKGHSFVSTGDAEVALKAYEEWGVDCFSRFNGMWALALADFARRKLILSRDRLGKKPLYYCRAGSSFVFGSEIKSLLRFPGVPRTPNYEKLFRYLSTNYRFVDIDNESFFAQIHQVPKGSFLEIESDLSATSRPYWHLPEKYDTEISEKDAVARFLDLFTDAVRLRLRSDVPVGCMLSGGLDSTSIACIAYKRLGVPIITFSGITGDKPGVYDESEYINEVVNEIGATHHYIRPEPARLIETLTEMLSYHDEPVCTVTWYTLYLIAKKIRGEGVPVILNGHGGDELLAGYWDHYHYHFFDLRAQGDEAEARYEEECWKKNHGRNPAELEQYRTYISALANGTVNSMSRFPDYTDCLAPEMSRKYKKEIRLVSRMPTMLARRQHLELLWETIPASLRPEDRNTMACSLESRSPFLDYRLNEFCFSLPGKFKIRHGLGKWVLREAVKGILPEKVRSRKDKAGFIAPADEWFRRLLPDQIQEIVSSRVFSERGIYNVPRVKQVIEEHCNGGANHAQFLWQLLNAELWLRTLVDTA